MPSFRRKHLAPTLFLLLFLLGLYTYHTSTPYRSPYLETLERIALSERAQSALDSASMHSGLRAAEAAAKAAAREKAGPRPPPPPVPRADEPKADEHTGLEFPVGGKYVAAEEVSRILQLRTIVIFSKSHCPYSAKAKHILLEKYKINPVPYVVELDKHPHGAELQEALKKKTERGTVPNVLVAGFSIGGGDDVEELDKSGKLPETLRKHAGHRIKQIFVLRENSD